jgi:hypothetical protein
MQFKKSIGKIRLENPFEDKLICGELHFQKSFLNLSCLDASASLSFDHEQSNQSMSINQCAQSFHAI